MKRLAIIVGLIGLFIVGGANLVLAQPQTDSTYVVKEGDTLFSIARQFDVSVQALRRWNDLTDTTVTIGQRLRVRPPAETGDADASASDSTYVVQAGDTLFRIARMHGVSVEALRRWNDLASDTVRTGQILRVRPPEEPVAPTPPPADTIPQPADTTARAEADTAAPPPSESDTTLASDTTAIPPDTAATPSGASGPVSTVPADETLIDAPIDPLRHGTYTIQQGDTFYSVAVRYGLSADTLFALNGEHRAPLPSGRVLRLPAEFAVPSHVLEEGETIYDIAGQYGVSVRALERANGISRDEIDAGQRLRIPGRDAPDPPRHARPPAEAEGPVAVYPTTFEGRLTASGAPYDPDAFVASHPSLPFDTVVLLTNPATGRSTFARVIDRGPVEEQYLIDVSVAVADQLELDRESEQPIELRIMR